MTPKKPNSAVRHVAKVTLSNKLFLTARMPGGEPYAKKFAKVLVEGGRANDLVGVNYTLKRRNYDFPPLVSKTRRRSIYGTSRPENHTKHVRRSLRGIGQ